MISSKIFTDRLSIAYILFILSFLLHVIDEALNDFLDFYNPIVLRIREQFSFFPLPVFSFRLWISGLFLLILILLSITIFIYNRRRVFLFILKIFSYLMIMNGLWHIVGSIYYSKFLPGLYSSPVLIGFSIYFILTLNDIKD